MKKKRLIAVLLAGVMIFVLGACGKQSANAETSSSEQSVVADSSVAASSEEQKADAQASENKDSGSSQKSSGKTGGKDASDLPAVKQWTDEERDAHNRKVEAELAANRHYYTAEEQRGDDIKPPEVLERERQEQEAIIASMEAENSRIQSEREAAEGGGTP